jgi:hypothetical protein
LSTFHKRCDGFTSSWITFVFNFCGMDGSPWTLLTILLVSQQQPRWILTLLLFFLCWQLICCTLLSGCPQPQLFSLPVFSFPGFVEELTPSQPVQIWAVSGTGWRSMSHDASLTHSKFM